MNVPHDNLRGAYRSNVIALIAFALVLSLAWLWFAFNPVPLGRSVMMLDNPTVHGSAALCPGDTLRFSFVTTVHTPAVVDFDITTWGQDPRRIILQRPTQRMVMAEPHTWPVDWSFTVPDTYINLRSGEVETWRPGAYQLDAAITSVSQDTQVSMMSVPFTIRDDCR